MPVFQGMMAGLLAGIAMGIISEAAYRLRIFRSSLLVIDGSFAMRFLKGDDDRALIYLFGIPIHLLTGIVFGGVYLSGTHILKWDSQSPVLLSLYIILLWLGMLFVALPMAGQGLLGTRKGLFTWLEQLVLHIVYAIGLRLALPIV